MKEKLKSYDFWVSVASAVMVLLQTISIKIDVPYVNEITMAFLSLLAVTGILKKNGTKSVETASESGEDTKASEELTQPEEELENAEKTDIKQNSDGSDKENSQKE